MTSLVWDNTIARVYEAGVEKGVFYPSNGSGIVWNGLLSVSENLVGGELRSNSLDGIAYLNSVGSQTYQAIVRAFSAPEEFSPCIGDVEIVPGFALTRQKRSRFGFSYQTGVSDNNYKIHLVYNALASPTSRSYATKNDSSTPVNLEWKIDATPIEISGHRPAAHFIIDSSKVPSYAIAALEDIMYGSSELNARLPSITEVLYILQNAGPINTITEFVMELI